MDSKDVRIFCEMAFKYLDYNAFAKRHGSPLAIFKEMLEPNRPNWLDLLIDKEIHGDRRTTEVGERAGS